MLTALPRIVPVLARHALGYADLATEELDGIGTRLRRRALATTVCAVAASFAVLMLCCLAIAMAWDTPHRIVVIAGLTLAFLAVAIVAGEAARRERRQSARLLPKLSSEWNRDRETLRRVLAPREERP